MDTAFEALERLSGAGILHLAVTWYTPLIQPLPHATGPLVPSAPIAMLLNT
jgi:hypothetical protein